MVKTYTPKKARRAPIRARLGAALFRLRWTLAEAAYQCRRYDLSRKLCRPAYWTAYAAELGALYERGDRLPAEQETRL